jgi:hypothetical protein
MKSLLLVLAAVLCFAVESVYGDEGWGPYVHQSPIMIQQAPVIQNFQVIQYYAPIVIMPPPVPQYFPVTVYQNFLVERRYHCFFKRYEVISVPQTLYAPNRY